MSVGEILVELALLEKLEQILIAQRIVIEKIIIMPKGQQKKVSGATCNAPVDCDQTCKVLPQPPERSGIIMLKRNRKLEFRGHVYFQAVRFQFQLFLVRRCIQYKMADDFSMEDDDFKVDLQSQEVLRAALPKDRLNLCKRQKFRNFAQL